MSEDLLDQALQDMKDERVDAAMLATARTRVWNNVNAGAACAEFRQDFRAYLAYSGGPYPPAHNGLSDKRRSLVEDHLTRCPSCRTVLADMKGERTVVAMPVRASRPRWVRQTALAAAAALFLSVLYLSRDSIDAMMAPSGPRATVVSADRGLYGIDAGSLAGGTAISEREVVRTAPGAHAVLRLADDSMIDVNERTELFVTAAWSGQTIHLQHGDIIVKAAKQRRGRLRVLTHDSIASVKGTVFAVSAGMGGSVVSVVEGSVAVNQPGKQLLLKPGQQAASSASLASSVANAVSWSPDRQQYLELLASFAHIDSELAKFPADMRTQSALLSQLPAGAIVYGAVPNPGITIGRALALADDQAAQNATFGAWWNSDTGQQLRQMADRIQSVNQMLGDEIVFCASDSGSGDPIPMVIARVQPGKRPDLTSALQGVFAAAGAAGESAGAFSVTDDLMVVSASPSNLSWALAHLGQGADSPFAAAIAERYTRGVGWLVGIDARPLVARTAGEDTPPIKLAGMMSTRHIFLEQRAPGGAEENEVTFTFDGARTGLASWLADAGSGGAAEYLPADVLAAGYISTREPLQLFKDLTSQLTRTQPDFERGLASLDETFGPGFVQDITGALGTEAALALTGFSTSGPTWVAAIVANSPPVIDSSMQKVVDAFNAQLGPGDQGKRIVFAQEIAGGRTWSSLKPGGLPLGVVWTYDQGYMVAASDRGSAERAIATHNAGSPLVWSPDFLGKLPSSAGLHPSAFGWVNAKGALGILSTLSSNQTLHDLVAARDPILVTFDGSPDLIHAASRTRITGLIMDAMLFENLTRATMGHPQ